MKHCTGCKHFYFSQGDPGYSEYTPGIEASMTCYKKHWEIDFYDDNQQSLHKKLTSAETCPDYAAADYAE